MNTIKKNIYAIVLITIILVIFLSQMHLIPKSGDYYLVRYNGELSKHIKISFDFDNMVYSYISSYTFSPVSDNGSITIKDNIIKCTSIVFPKEYYFLINNRKEIEFLEDSSKLSLDDETIEPHMVFRLVRE